MSKITLEPNISGAGTFSIRSPNSNSNRDFLLSDSGGTLLTDLSDIPANSLVGQLNTSSSAPGSTVNVEYRPSQSMGRKNMSSGSGGTFFDETCCPSPYTTVQANSKIIWYFSIIGTVGSTHIAAYGQFSIDDGSNWIDAQQFSGTDVQGAWAFSWQTNDNNADTHGSYALIPGGSYSSGTQIKFRMAFYSPQQYDVSVGGSNSNWRSLQYARGQHVIMEIAE